MGGKREVLPFPKGSPNAAGNVGQPASMAVSDSGGKQSSMRHDASHSAIGSCFFLPTMELYGEASWWPSRYATSRSLISRSPFDQR